MRSALLLLALLSFSPAVSYGDATPTPTATLSSLTAKEFTTLDETRQGVRAIAGALRGHGNRRGLFAGIYALTIEATAGMLARGEFRNQAWVRSLVVNYANIYRRGLHLELTGQRAQLPLGWELAYGYIARTVPYAEEGKETWSADLDAVYGIQVHIARDLVEALFVTPTNFASASQRADFFLITEALRGTMPAIYSLFTAYRGTWSPFAPIEQGVMMNWIADLRAGAWANAAANSRLGPAGRRGVLAAIDQEGTRRARKHGALLPLLPR